MKLTKEEFSWILYDIANSAFILIVTATIPVYFSAIATGDGLSGQQVTLVFSQATSISVIILAVLAPVLGAIADHKGNKKKLFALFLILGILGGLSLCVVQKWQAFIVMFTLARIGYSACNVFYDSMLVDVTTNNRMDMISSRGYAFGYIGSVIPFIIGIALIMFSDTLGIETTFATQISFLITILWWAILSIPLLKNVKQVHYVPKEKHVIKNSFKNVFKTLRKIKEDKRLLYFILAYFFYIDGVYTIISQATIFGSEVGLDANGMILALLLTQFVAFPFALLATPLANRFGTLKVIKAYIVIYAGVCIFGFTLHSQWQFWVLAVVIGMVQGGVQSLSRSYFGKIIPKKSSNEYFGFFDIFGKFADFFGPLILSLSVVLFDASRYGILMLVILFVIGFILLTKVEKHERLMKLN